LVNMNARIGVVGWLQVTQIDRREARVLLVHNVTEITVEERPRMMSSNDTRGRHHRRPQSISLVHTSLCSFVRLGSSYDG